MGDDELLDAIAALHSAAGDPDLWPVAFDRISDLMRASGMLIGRLPHSGGAFELVGHRIDPTIVEQINGPLASRDANPVFSAVPRAPVLRPVIASAVVDDSTLMRSRTYDEAMRPAGLRFCIATVLACDADRSYALAFGRDELAGDFDREDARRFATISPHILGAVHAQHRIASLRGEAAVLDMLDRGVVALDSSGRVLFMNQEAERILGASDGLQVRSGRIEATRRSDDAKLRALLRPEAGIAEMASALTIERPSMLPSYSLVVAPFATSAEGLPAFGRRPDHIVFLRDPVRLAGPRRDWLAQLYGLTRAEAEVALDLHAGLSPGEIAARRGNSANTVKTHMKAVFAKVGVTRQAELVGAIALAVGDLRVAD